MEGIGRRRAVMSRLDAEDGTRARRSGCAPGASCAGVAIASGGGAPSGARRRDRQLFASALSNVRRRWDESWRTLAAPRWARGASSRRGRRARRRSAERVEWAVDLCVQSATRLAPAPLLARRPHRSVVADVVAGWTLLVTSARTASKLVHQTAAAMVRHRAERVKPNASARGATGTANEPTSGIACDGSRRSEIAAHTHRFNARVRARRAQFRAWHLETKTGALTRERRWRNGARAPSARARRS